MIGNHKNQFNIANQTLINHEHETTTKHLGLIAAARAATIDHVDHSMHFNNSQNQSNPSHQKSIGQLLINELVTIINENITNLINPHHNRNLYHLVPQETTTTTTILTTIIPDITTTTTATSADDSITDEPFSFHDETKPYISAEKWYDKYLWWRIILVFYILVLGIVGNSAIIYSICKVPRFRPQPTNIFILNMAIGDLIASIFCPIVALIRVVNEFYVMGAFICRIEGFVKVTCLFVSSYSLIVLSFQWLLCVVKPFWRRMTIVHSWLALGVIWTLSLAMGFPLLFTRELRSRKWANLVERWCQEVALVVILIKMDKFGYKLRKSSPNQRSITTTATTSNSHYHSSKSSSLVEHPSNTMELQSAIPIISSSTSKYDHSLTSYNNNNASHLPVDGNSNQHDSRQFAAKDARTLNVNMKYRRHIVSILLMYLLVSAICWLPLNLSIIYRLTTIGKTFFPNSFNEFNFFCELGVATSSALNPIIFGFLSRPFRQIIKRSWTNMLNLLCNLTGFQVPVNNDNHRKSSNRQRAKLRALNNKNNDQRAIKLKTLIQKQAVHRSAQNNQLASKKSVKDGKKNRDSSYLDANGNRNCIIVGSSTNNDNARSTTAASVSKLIGDSISKPRSSKRVTFEQITGNATSITGQNNSKNASFDHSNISSGLAPLKSSLKRICRNNNVKPMNGTISNGLEGIVVVSNVNLNPTGNSVMIDKEQTNHERNNSVKPIQQQQQQLNRQPSVESMASISIEIPTPVDESDQIDDN